MNINKIILMFALMFAVTGHAATIEQLYDALGKADAAGDEYAAQNFATRIKALKSAGVNDEDLIPGGSKLSTKEGFYANAYQHGTLTGRKKEMYEEAVRRGLMLNPELKARLPLTVKVVRPPDDEGPWNDYKEGRSVGDAFDQFDSPTSITKVTKNGMSESLGAYGYVFVWSVVFIVTIMLLLRLSLKWFGKARVFTAVTVIVEAIAAISVALFGNAVMAGVALFLGLESLRAYREKGK
ncbi:hypothetical protein [Buttiauxella brennerae]|uniref:hypothetical protein n=1 Tax=Buttiauxella brennerae TaxID=82988 RepID=UPI00286F3077|nr:hypothetical protein [Buttiauxella brennerae]